MSIKNFLFQTLISLNKIISPKRNEGEDPNHPRILVVSTTGLGDTLWGTPAIRAIKKQFPNSHLGVLTSPIGKEIFSESPHVDTLHVIQGPALLSGLKLLPTLRKEKWETILIFHTSERSLLPLCQLTQAATIVGTKGINKGLDSLLTNGIEPTPMHEIARRLAITKEIGVEKNGYDMEIFLTVKEEKETSPFIGDSKQLQIGIHPGAKDRFKQWSPRHFITLGKKLSKEKQAHILITGGKGEEERAAKIARQIPGAHSLAGKLSIRQTAALIKQCHLFITNDTGPMHLSFAVKTPTIALFSPTDPMLCGPYEISHAAILAWPPTCTPCFKKRCRYPFCLEQIPPDEVYDNVKTLL